MSKRPNQLISLEEAAQRVVDSVPEIESFEISPGSLRLNFSRQRRIPGTDVFSNSVTFAIAETMVPEWTITDVIQRLRATFDRSILPSESKKGHPTKRGRG